MNRNVKGVVIKEQPSGEKGKLLYVLTDTEGVVVVNAAGGRTISASYLKSAQLFAYSEMTVYDKGGRLTLTEATLIENFYGIRNNMLAFACASYMSELCLMVAVPDDEGILRHYLNCLYALSREVTDIDKIKAVFEYRLCVLMGVSPDFSSCSLCDEQAVCFDFDDTAAYCKSCAPNIETAYHLKAEEIRAFEYLADCPHGKILSFSIPKEQESDFNRFCEKYMIIAVDAMPKSLETYRSVRKDF